MLVRNFNQFNPIKNSFWQNVTRDTSCHSAIPTRLHPYR